MDAPQESFYPTEQESILVIFDLRDPDERPRLRERMHRERRSWGRRAAIEMLAFRVFALVVRPGGLKREARREGTGPARRRPGV